MIKDFIVTKLASTRLVPISYCSIECMWKNIHHAMLPNYLKTFNYELVWDLLPLKAKPYIAVYHGSKLCSFCKRFEETVKFGFLVVRK